MRNFLAHFISKKYIVIIFEYGGIFHGNLNESERGTRSFSNQVVGVQRRLLHLSAKMAKFSAERNARQRALAATLRATRHHRGMGVRETASAMGMPVRSYQHFEAGRSRLNIDTVYAFASATRSDPIALLVAILLNAPEIALRSADNKLVSALLMNLDAFNDRVGDNIARLRTNVIELAFRQAFDVLAADADQPDQTGSWIAQHLRSPLSDDPDKSE